MISNFFRATFFLTVASLLSQCSPADRGTPEEIAIREVIDSYVAAFEAEDVEALGEHWTVDGVYTTPTGDEIVGRAAIAKAMAEMFAESSNAGLTVSLDSVEATDDQTVRGGGIASVFVAGVSPQCNRYSAEFKKEGDRWQISSIDENDVATNPAAPGDWNDDLEPLAWMAGTWVDQGVDSTVYYHCEWTPDGDFLSRSYAIATDEGIRGSGYEIIGWDDKTSKFRSRVYDSSGVVAEAEWSGTDEDGKWVRKSSGTLADGKKATAVQTIRKIDDQSFGIRIAEQSVDGQPVPDIEEVIVKKIELKN